MPQGTPLHMPFPVEVSPGRDAAEQRNLRWARSHGLLNSESAEQRYRTWKLADLAARTNPRAEAEDLGVVLDTLGFMFLFDDQFDGPLGTQHRRARDLCESLAALTRPAPPPYRRSDVPVLDAWKELWPRCAQGMSPAWRERAARHFRAYFLSHVRETANRALGRAPNLRDYLHLRRDTVAMRPLQDLIERVGHVEVPARAHHSPQLREMREITTLVIALNNDISSLEKEAARGDGHNLILVLRSEQGTSQREAIGMIGEMTREHVERFLRLDSRTPSLADALGLGAEERAALAHLVTGMRHWMRGCYDWEAFTARYAPDTLLPADGPGHLEDLVTPRNGRPTAR